MKYFIILLSILSAIYIYSFPIKEDIPSTKNLEGIISIETDNYANKTLNSYYYIPKSKHISQNMPIIVMLNGLSSRGDVMVTPALKSLAEQDGFIIVAPTFIFDEKNWATQTSYQYPNAWSGQALLNIINKLKIQKRINPGKIYIMGFSAGAQFAGRFASAYSDKVSAAIVYGSGAPIKLERNTNVRFLVGVGNQDINDRKLVASQLVKQAKALGIDAVYKEYNCGHSLCPELLNDTINFFKKVKRENRE